MKVINEFPATERHPGHHYVETYVRTELYCPQCGTRGVWQEQGAGDYYQGVKYYCVACASRHHLDNSCSDCKDYNERLILKQLLEGEMAQPITRYRVRR